MFLAKVEGLSEMRLRASPVCKDGELDRNLEAGTTGARCL